MEKTTNGTIKGDEDDDSIILGGNATDVSASAAKVVTPSPSKAH